ncbi:hypothetical protein [Leucobacter sp. W1478]|uniref:hypothetical protein n=1 Tax=Leucobacter sp. W1478 TaxID=3439065 RepID=UPI003F3106A8
MGTRIPFIKMSQSNTCDTPFIGTNEELLDASRHLFEDKRTRQCPDGRRCRKRLCPVCSSVCSQRDIASYEDVAAHFDDCASVTLTIKDGENFAEQIAKLRSVIGHWFRLMKNHDSEYITVSIEVTDNDPSWHVHAHAAIFGNDPKALGLAAIQCWIEAASLADVTADPRGQEFSTKYPPLAPEGVPDAISYVHKAKLHHGEGSLRETLVRAGNGDNRARERFREAELFMLGNPGFRWRRSTPKRKPISQSNEPTTRESVKRTKYTASDSKISLVVLGEMFGISKQLLSTMETTSGNTLSESTIARARRSPQFKAFKKCKDSPALMAGS